MRTSLNPALPVIVRANCSNIDDTIAFFVSELTPGGGGFNYLDATKAVKAAYKGLHSICALTAGPRFVNGSVGSRANLEVASMVCPLAFNRKTSLISLSPRTFQYGAGRSAAYRLPFVFTEGRSVKAYFLQPRKRVVYTRQQVSLYASIVKKYLLDAEFYGETVDIEFVEAASRSDGAERSVISYSMSDLDIWDDRKIAEHLAIVQEALSFIEDRKLVEKPRRPLKDPDLPLFG